MVRAVFHSIDGASITFMIHNVRLGILHPPSEAHSALFHIILALGMTLSILGYRRYLCKAFGESRTSEVQSTASDEHLGVRDGYLDAALLRQTFISTLVNTCSLDLVFASCYAMAAISKVR